MPAAAHHRSRCPAGNRQLKRLLIRPGAIGDCIVSLPALEYLKADDTEIWVPAPNVPLIRFGGRVRAIASTGLNLVGVVDYDLPVLATLAAFDSIVSWYGTNREDFRRAVAHLPFTFHAALPDPAMHAVDFYMRQAGGPPGAVPRLDCPRNGEPGGYIALHPFSGSPGKNWPLANYLELARRLGGDVRFLAGPDDALADAVRIANLYQVACWLARARLYIGNDSGITHLAAAVGTPVVALFGPTDPRVWAPRGERVRVLRRQPIEAITVDHVLHVIA
ncbi:MAG: glycosyltransferase family 9 protein [Acidobacteria bacterium]|nr:glycosyltransferase family 9 protein [Acidobacteriota bacterium]